MDSKAILTGTALAAGVFEIVQAATLDMVVGQIMAAAFGAVFLAVAWLLGRRTTGPAIGLVVIFGLELLLLPMYDRVTLADWLVQGAFGVLALAGLVAGLRVLTSRRSSLATREAVPGR